jgi:hypothetical protein
MFAYVAHVCLSYIINLEILKNLVNIYVAVNLMIGGPDISGTG